LPAETAGQNQIFSRSNHAHQKSIGRLAKLKQCQTLVTGRSFATAQFLTRAFFKKSLAKNPWHTATLIRLSASPFLIGATRGQPVVKITKAILTADL
jgi:hypothetical protein